MLFFTGWTRGTSALLAVVTVGALVVGLAEGAGISAAVGAAGAVMIGFVLLERITTGVRSDPRMQRPPSDDEATQK